MSATKTYQLGKSQARAALQSKPSIQLYCRGLQHSWDARAAATRIVNPQTKRELPLLQIDRRCLRGCDVTRHELFVVRRVRNSQSLEIVERLASRYTYPKGYLLGNLNLPKGLRKSMIVWQEIITRDVNVNEITTVGETTNA